MKDEGIKRVCCLMTQKEMRYYEDEDLLQVYLREFGQDHVFWVSIEDYHLCDTVQLKERILPFLKKSDVNGEKVVVHCSGGSGRTGHVLAGWLVFKYGLSADKALSAIHVLGVGRDPCEAVRGKTAINQLYDLLTICKKSDSS